MAIRDLTRRMFKHQPKGIRSTVTVPMSFETGELGAVKVYFAHKVRIVGIRSQVVKAVAATNDGTITGANADGASAGGVITHAASAAIGSAGTGLVSPTTNNEVAAGSYYQLTSAKVNAGGKMLVTLDVITI